MHMGVDQSGQKSSIAAIDARGIEGNLGWLTHSDDRLSIDKQSSGLASGGCDDPI